MEWGWKSFTRAVSKTGKIGKDQTQKLLYVMVENGCYTDGKTEPLNSFKLMTGMVGFILFCFLRILQLYFIWKCGFEKEKLKAEKAVRKLPW